TKEDGTINPNNSDVNSKKEAKIKKESIYTKESNGTCININSASLDELQQIIHIGQARSEAIIDQRPFRSVDQLTSIKGIGSVRIADIKTEGLACIGG